MNLNDLTKPKFLVNSTINHVEKIDYSHYLQRATKLSIKEKSLIGCYIVDCDNEIYQIENVFDIGPCFPWWRFEFFNAFRMIELEIVLINDLTLKTKIHNKLEKFIKQIEK